MKALNKETAKKTVRPERIIQFGEIAGCFKYYLKRKTL